MSSDPMQEMDKAVSALALELPKSVWDDVAARWQRACREVERLRADRDARDVMLNGRERTIRELETERDRLRDGIRKHRERCKSQQEAVGGPDAPQDLDLWTLLDGEDTDEHK